MAVGTASLVLAMAPTALAEGSFSSSVSSALTGFQSRWWTKNQNYDTSTVIKFTGCSATGADSSTRVQLTKYKSGPLPDENRGQKTFTNCFTSSGASSSGNWGTQRGGGDQYRFAIIEINGSTYGSRVSVDRVDVWY
ncbi:hypothetical protein [Streptomyces chryseus]|uniref:hypothetical protein n=1 Tax=Streptomyces chryseus TaxID=68186 RepID=UPI00110F9565|nr:hypothetical protein [Streptomyces chryseus]GGX40842.1 hypothetical protein GCM10010353_65250 [Streptomyces chryseus]